MQKTVSVCRTDPATLVGLSLSVKRQDREKRWQR